MGKWGWVLSGMLFGQLTVAAPVTFRARGVNHEVLLEKSVEAGMMSLSELSNQVLSSALQHHEVSDYQGANEGVLSINHLGNGIEVFSQTDFNAYGWCYQIDGKATNALANEYFFSGLEQVIEWYYAYENLDGANWSGICTPATHLPPLN